MISNELIIISCALIFIIWYKWFKKKSKIDEPEISDSEIYSPELDQLKEISTKLNKIIELLEEKK